MVQLVDSTFVQERLRDGRTRLLNVLSRESYDKRHIPGSLNAPVEAEEFEAKVAELVPDKSTPVITHCSGMACPASTKAADKLLALGYTEVYDYKAGIEGWEQEGLPFARPARPERKEQHPKQRLET